jgi:iron complex outermembrane receptor protein
MVNQNAIATMQDDIFNASVSVNHYGKLFNFTSQTAYQSNFRIYDKPLDGDFSPLDIITIFNNYGNKYNNVSVWTEEFKFSTPVTHEGRLNWTAGGFFFLQDNPVKQATGFGTQAPLLGFPDSNFSIININNAKNLGLSFFGQANYALSEKLSLTLGLRYDYENKKLAIRGEYLREPNPPITVISDTSAENNFSAFSPKLAMSYTLKENQLLYLSYSRGFRTGGLTQLGSDPSQLPLFSYDPEFSDNFEAGWKNTWFKNKIRLNLAAFVTHVSQAQVPTLVLPDAITQIQNAGTLMSKGFEVELNARPLKGLELQYNFGYTDAEYTRLRLSQNGQELNLDGNRQIFTPSSTSMLVAQYSFPLKFKKPVLFIARGEWIHLGNQYFDLANTIEQEAYSLLNARVGVNLKRFDVFLWGRNLGQQKYIAFAYDFGGVHLGDPRTYGVTVSVRL